MLGWICPKCQKVYSPSVTECYSCNNTNKITITPQPNTGTAAPVYPWKISIGDPPGSISTISSSGVLFENNN